MRQPATYQEIQKWVESRFGFMPETCWIAHCKELCGLPLGEAPNRRGDERAKPCPPEKRPAIKEGVSAFWNDGGSAMSTVFVLLGVEGGRKV
jgi:hypothetical protein